MIFASPTFLFAFLPLFFLVYYGGGFLVGRRFAPTFRTAWLIGASYVFYGWERYSYVFLILFSTLVDHFCARAVHRSREASDGSGSKRRYLALSIVTNLGLLGYFKYSGFFAETIARLAGQGGGSPPSWTDVVLPVGISFYTFQSMSYTIDVYRGRVEPVRRFRDLVCYVALFPQLVAGPIVRFRDIAGDLVRRTHTLDKAGRGAFLFMIGFAKKTLIANNVGPLADAAFSSGDIGLIEAWCGVLAYTLQIYFDFSGYSDMAIGLGLMIGFRFPQNFDSPYRARSITEFWRRWHISLSSWLRDYLYIPLGGNRHGRLRTYANLMITMLLGGLWHGANWTFVLWGAWHGAWLAIERITGAARSPGRGRQVLTLILVMIGWIFFRAESVDDALRVLGACVGAEGLGTFNLMAPRPASLALFVLAVAWPATLVTRNSWQVAGRIRIQDAGFALVVYILGIGQMLFQGFNPFLYFRF